MELADTEDKYGEKSNETHSARFLNYILILGNLSNENNLEIGTVPKPSIELDYNMYLTRL